MADDPRNGPPALTTRSSSSSQPAPPASLHADVPSAADHARRRIQHKRAFLAHLFSRTRRFRTSSATEELDQVHSSPAPQHRQSSEHSAAEQPVTLEHSVLSDADDYDKDVYRWAVLYENQRGLTLFSTPYYSPLSLLPLDPPPFTVPSASDSSRAGQPTVSLTSYPLPDGTWRWVSRSWMVDMRGDGQTQYDGFQYNWFFRSRKWRAEAGNFGAGGWVRRRRWIRLMMRQAQAPPSNVSQTRPGSVDNIPLTLEEEGATRPPSVTSMQDSSIYEGDVWDGDEDEDWVRCRMALRKVGRDGRKLELWKQWLGQSTPATLSPDHPTANIRVLLPPKSALNELTTSVDSSSAPKHRIASLLRQHGSQILQSFVYPESRAQFIDLLLISGLLPELRTSPDDPSPLAMLDFWSYASSLDRLSELDEIR